MYLYTRTHTYLHINTHWNTGNDCLSKDCCRVCVECLEPWPASCDHEVGEPEGQSWPSKWEWHGIVVKSLNLSRHCWSIELTNFASALLQDFLLSKIVNSQYHLSYLEMFFKKKNNSPILTESLYVLKHKDITRHYKNSDFFLPVYIAFVLISYPPSPVNVNLWGFYTWGVYVGKTDATNPLRKGGCRAAATATRMCLA